MTTSITRLGLRKVTQVEHDQRQQQAHQRTTQERLERAEQIATQERARGADLQRRLAAAQARPATATPAPIPAPVTADPRGSTSLGLTALILGLVALPLALLPLVDVLGFILSIPAIVVGLVGDAKHPGERNAVAGLLCGLAALVFGLVLNVFVYGGAL